MGREQIANHAKHQVRKRLTSPEELRDSIGCAWTTDDGLQYSTQACPARHGLALLIIKPPEVGLRKASVTLSDG